MEYYKKIDKSIFKYGATIPKKYVPAFIFNRPIQVGTKRKVRLIWKKKIYEATIYHFNRKNATPVHHLRWDNNEELIVVLKKEFIQTYFAIESQNYEAKRKGKYYVTKLLGGNQEVLVFRPKSVEEIELETFIRIETPYDNLFKRLVDENVFGWLTWEGQDYLITKSTPWYDMKDLYKHEDTNHVVYYLIDTENEEVYIGSAKRLGDRVIEGRKEIPVFNVKYLFPSCYLTQKCYHSCG
jgi:hypothetical protein